MTLIALTGPQRVGKDLVASILVERHGFQRVAFADALKAMCEDLNPIVDPSRYKRLKDVVEEIGWEKAKDGFPEVRRTQQRLATEVIRDWVDPDFWIIQVEAYVNAYSGPDYEPNIVVSDLRFPNENSWVLKRGGWLWDITRPGYEHKSGEHISEVWRPQEGQPNLVRVANDATPEDLAVAVGVALQHCLNKMEINLASISQSSAGQVVRGSQFDSINFPPRAGTTLISPPESNKILVQARDLIEAAARELDHERGTRRAGLMQAALIVEQLL